MKCFQIIAAAIVLNFSANLFAVDQAWQRIQVLGSSVDGNKILIFKSHFGPSSAMKTSPDFDFKISVPYEAEKSRNSKLLWSIRGFFYPQILVKMQ